MFLRERGVYTAREYDENPSRVVEHAAKYGSAVVLDDDGRRLLVIDINTTKLPVLE